MLTINDHKLVYLLAKANNTQVIDLIIDKYELLVWRHVNTVLSGFVPLGVERDDLFQEGQIALYNAMYTYDNAKEVPFFFFARLCIERSLLGYLRKFQSLANKQFYNSVALDAFVSEEVSLYYSDVISDNSENSLLVKYDEDLGLLYKSSNKINEFEKNVLILQVAGYTYKETSAYLNCTVKKVDNTIQKIKRILT